MITNYNEFKSKLYDAGFSMGGINDEGIFSISSLYGENIQWHTDDIDTDPWEWRMRVLQDKEDIAYAKVFFKKSGFITKQWYPYFLSIRRPNTLEHEYYNGNISNDAKKTYEIIQSNNRIPLHILKAQCNVSKSTKSAFDRALVELQMKMYITMCGRARKTSIDGKPYGWSSTIFCLSEEYFGSEVFDIAATIDPQDAIDKITKQIYTLNPNANGKKVSRFITG